MDYINVGRLAVWHHPTPRAAKARILLIHGICEHSGRHLGTVEALNQFDYEVVRFDLRGSGRSGGRRQHIESFADYCEDALSIFNWTRGELLPLPLFLMGHSLGGAIAIHSVTPIQRALQGLILSAPAFITGSAISPLRIALGRLINHMLPTFQIPSGSDQGCLSRIPEVVTAYEKDPLSFHFNTVRQGDAVLRAMSDIPLLLPAIELPVLLVHGTHDRLTLLKGSYEILRRLGSRSRTMHIIPGGYHEPHNDLGREEYFRALHFWIGSQLRIEVPAFVEDSANAHTTRRQPQAE